MKKVVLLISSVVCCMTLAAMSDEVPELTPEPVVALASAQEAMLPVEAVEPDVLKEDLAWLITQLPQESTVDNIDPEQDRMNDEQLLSQYVEFMRRLRRIEKDFARAQRLDRNDAYIIVQYLRKEKTRMRHLLATLQAKSKIPLPDDIDDFDSDEYEGMSLKQWFLLGAGLASVAGLVALSTRDPQSGDWGHAPSLAKLQGNMEQGWEKVRNAFARPQVQP